MRGAGAALLIVIGGCSGPSAWMPLEPGLEWTYVVRDSYGSRVMRLRVIEPIRVGLEQGWLLKGDGGDTRMAWVGNELTVSELSGTRFEPPITFLKPSLEHARWTFTGISEGLGRRARVRAELRQKPEKLTVDGLARATLAVSMTMSRESRQVEVKTWFERGLGVLRQEQRSNGRRTVALELVSGG